MIIKSSEMSVGIEHHEDHTEEETHVLELLEKTANLVLEDQGLWDFAVLYRATTEKLPDFPRAAYGLCEYCADVYTKRTTRSNFPERFCDLVCEELCLEPDFCTKCEVEFIPADTDAASDLVCSMTCEDTYYDGTD